MKEVIRIGIDTSKHVFQVHGVDAAERPVLRKKLRRADVERFFAALSPTQIGLEACGAAHHWARVLQGLGHEVRLLPPQYVKPYVKRGKNDAADAEAICEALSRPTMRFAPIRTAENQAELMLLGARELLVRQRTMLANALRGHAAEFGIAGAKGLCQIGTLLERIAAANVPELARDLFASLARQFEALDQQIAALDERLEAWHRATERSRRLATVPGIGVIGAAALTMKVADPNAFRSGRHFAAWIGLTPRDHSTAGRQRLGVITKKGDEMLRHLLVSGAMAVIHRTRPERQPPWLRRLLARKPKKLVAVALANKTARIAWALMSRGRTYQRPVPV
jgi:transposase